ncbi:unnamed protein product, partial [Ectocarpus fasciculatus]
VLEIVQVGDPVLTTPAAAVDDSEILSQKIQQLIQDMTKTMYAAPGIGLAAPQIGVSLRIVVFYLPAGRAGGAEVPLTVLINPSIEKIGDSLTVDWEGCLSVADKRGRVSRHDHIRYRGLDAKGLPVDVTARGWHARVVQHECDHLDGILYPELM